MRLALLTLISLYLSSAHALAPERLARYDCAYMGDDSVVSGLTIYESQLGRRNFFEVGVHATLDGQEIERFRTVNLVSEYEGRVQTYGTGNFRVKVNRVYPVEGKFRAFARLPEFGMHSSDWTCKDAY